MKNLLKISIVYVLCILVFFGITMPQKEQHLGEKESQKFFENRQVFEDVKEYFLNLNYEEVINNSSEGVVLIDNVKYRLYDYNDNYAFGLEYDSQDEFNNLFFSVAEISFAEIMGYFNGFNFLVNKETFQLDSFRMNISPPGYDLIVEYYENMPTSNVLVAMGDYWYIGGYGYRYNDTIGEEEFRNQVIIVICLILLAIMTVYLLCSWCYIIIKMIIKKCIHNKE